MAHEGDWKTILKKILRPMSRWYANYYMSCGEDCGRWQLEHFFLKFVIDHHVIVVNLRRDIEDLILQYGIALM